MPTVLDEQLAKLNPNSGAQQLLGRIHAENAAKQAAAGTGGQRPPTLLEQTAATAAENERARAEQAAIEAEHGKLATVATQFGRGVLDMILAPAALVGAAEEAKGKLFGWQGLEDLGRGLGRSANADAAIDAGAYLFGGGGKTGLTTAERVSRQVSEQQKAWPTLSTISHVAGMAAPAVVGGVAAGGARGLTAIGMGTFEGASGGAQIAYEKNASLRDVVSSALVGGALGAGIAGAGEGVASLVQSKALRAAAKELREDANLAAVGVKRTDMARIFGSEAGVAEQKAAEMAEAVSSYRFQTGSLEGKPLTRVLRTQDSIQEGVAVARQETEQALAAARADVIRKAAGNPETAPMAEAMARGSAEAAGQVDDIAERALTALGEDAAGFQVIRKQAQTFQELSALIQHASKAESTSSLSTALGAVTSIGSMISGSAGLPSIAKGLLTAVGGKVVQQRAASTVAVLANNLVTDTVANALGHVVPVLSGSAAGAAGRAAGKPDEAPKREPAKPLTPQEKQERYRKQLDTVNQAMTMPDLEKETARLEKFSDLPGPLLIAASTDMGQKMAQLHADMPKPVPNLRGKSFETLSSEQVRLANAMYEATVDPLSVFSDFASGSVDYDKVKYAWKQYPGLRDAAQAGLMDILYTQMSESNRAGVPDGMLSQMDNLFGFDGSLQPTLNRQFAARMSQLGASVRDQQKPAPPRGGGKLNLPGSRPTFTQRIAGQQG